MKAFADTLRLTTDRFQGGAAPQSDVAQARTQLETTQVQATDVAVQRAPLEHAIATLTTSDAARASYDATVAAYRQTTLSAFQQVEDNLAALRILAQKTGQQRNAVESAQQSLQLSTNRYRGGVDTYLQVLTAQTVALANQRNEIDILRRRVDASVLLVKALGGGWEVPAHE